MVLLMDKKGSTDFMVRGEKCYWEDKIEGKAWSSPVIWKDQIWLTNSSANGKSMDVTCINTNDGKIAYNLNLFKNETVEPLGNNVNSCDFPVIEEGMVYIHFGSYGTAAINTTNGKESGAHRS